MIIAIKWTRTNFGVWFCLTKVITKRTGGHYTTIFIYLKPQEGNFTNILWADFFITEDNFKTYLGA